MTTHKSHLGSSSGREGGETLENSSIVLLQATSRSSKEGPRFQSLLVVFTAVVMAFMDLHPHRNTHTLLVGRWLGWEASGSTANFDTIIQSTNIPLGIDPTYTNRRHQVRQRIRRGRGHRYAVNQVNQVNHAVDQTGKVPYTRRSDNHNRLPRPKTGLLPSCFSLSPAVPTCSSSPRRADTALSDLPHP